MADEGYPSKANRSWLRHREIAARLLERDDQIAHCRKKPAGPSTSGTSSTLLRSHGRRTLLQPRQGGAQPRDEIRQDRAQLPRHPCLAAALHWLGTGLSKTA